MSDKSSHTSNTSKETVPTQKELKNPLGLVPETSGQKKNKLLMAIGALFFLGVVVGLSVGLTITKDNEDVNDEGSASLNATSVEEEPDWCGEGLVGNGLCKDGHCCSAYGYCGFTEEYCVNGQTVAPEVLSPDRFCGDGFPGNGTCSNSTLCCSVKGTCEYTYFACGYWPDNRTRGPPCGDGSVGDGMCENTEECCSKFGWCGTEEEYCNNPPGTRMLRSTNDTLYFDAY